MINDLIEGLSRLHEANITHNAIRAANIYFSSKTNKFLIGGFSECIKENDIKDFNR
jgi:serine/threonine protein kinase